ncbi:GGDEF domain-containing protein [Shewanella sp. UCD-KL12]|uniref:GGDEF domain-containing protein n=1 Tax=Shewanella sp. UCD-KL12 TaxID=1917163 RepID=UPI000970B1F6|nr:GGDEF domain-containing protein [Shewanella sp. UCD-KL12]
MNLAKHLTDSEVSAKILRHAVPKMSELNIPVTPDNYAVWYEYYLGINLDLKRAIDGLISNSISFCTEVNAGLHKNYIQEKSPEVIENVQIETQIIINTLLTKITKLSHGTTGISNSLAEFNQELKQKPDVDVLHRLVDSLVDDMEGVIQSNKQMETSLNTMKEEVCTLKSEMENLNQVAMTDQLTSLNNRRAFDEEVLKQMQALSRSQTPSSLLVLDIDHFKQFNDKHGHLVGDKVLSYIAIALKQSVKGTDFVARYGGEEFAILLPDTCIDDAVKLAESIRKVIADRKLTIGKDKKLSLGSITVSVGVSTLNISDDRESYFVRADEALYRAKSSGRNCVRSE